jgi:hypothetical protein
MLAIGLERAIARPVAVAMEAGEAADIDDPEVHRLLAGLHPIGEHPAGAAARCDAEGVEAGADEEIPDFRRFAEDEIAVRREGFRAVDHLLDAGRGERRDAGERRLHMLLEMIPVVLEELEFEIAGDVAGGPGNRVRLVAAEDEAADLLLEIGAPVRIADGRHAGHDAVDLLGDDILVLDRLERHADARHRRDLARPHAGTENDLLAADRAVARPNGGDAAFLDLEAGAGDALEELRAMRARTLGERLGDVGGARLAVGRHEGGADEIVDLHQRPHRLHLRRRQEIHFEAEGMGGRRLAPELDPAIIGAREPKAAGLAPTGGKAGLLLELLIEADRVAKHLRDRGRGAELADEAGGMPGRAAGQAAAVDQDDIGLVIAGEMVGGRAADDAAADDDDPGMGGETARHPLPLVRSKAAWARAKRSI